MKVGRNAAKKFAKSLRYSADGLLPVVVSDTAGTGVLMLAYANSEAVALTLITGKAHFFSRSRNRLWMKGETSGNVMRVVSVWADCDRDALQYRAEVGGSGNACHTGRRSCFVRSFGDSSCRLGLAELDSIIGERIKDRPAGSYTARLAGDRRLAVAKIREESEELVEALQKKNRKEVAWEACDLIYHALVAAHARGVRLERLEKEFWRRHSNSKKSRE